MPNWDTRDVTVRKTGSSISRAGLKTHEIEKIVGFITQYGRIPNANELRSEGLIRRDAVTENAMKFIRANQDALNEIAHVSMTGEHQRLSQQADSLMKAAGIDTDRDYSQYLHALDSASQSQFDTVMQDIQRNEMAMLQAVGMQQRQLEMDIAKRRQQAIKGGMSSAQLATQEMQNIMAAQQGATQIAQQAGAERFGMIREFAGQSSMNQAMAFRDVTQRNQQTAANVLTQLEAGRLMK